MLDHSCQVQRHALSERRDDLYETPVVAVEALLRVERLPHRIWEPACGRGAIVNVLRAHGHEVVATDLVDYGIPITAPGYYRIDFLMERHAPEGTQAIVTNPPFKLAEEFVAHAIELAPIVVMLLRLAFLESDRRSGILEGRGLARIHARSDRSSAAPHGCGARRTTRMEFETREAGDEFSRAVIAAVLAQFPDAFDGAGE
jgi:hypothetical protein